MEYRSVILIPSDGTGHLLACGRVFRALCQAPGWKPGVRSTASFLVKGQAKAWRNMRAKARAGGTRGFPVNPDGIGW